MTGAGADGGPVALRPARPADAGAIAAIYAPHVAAGIASFELEPPDAGAIAARMAAAGDLYPWIVATDGGGSVIGYAYAGRFREREAYRWTVETSVYLHGRACGQGIGRRLYAALLLILERQGFAQAIGAISLPNAASVALHETLGFAAAGVLRRAGYKTCNGTGRWIDVGYWQRALCMSETPAEPLPLAAIGFIDG